MNIDVYVCLVGYSTTVVLDQNVECVEARQNYLSDNYYHPIIKWQITFQSSNNVKWAKQDNLTKLQHVLQLQAPVRKAQHHNLLSALE